MQALSGLLNASALVGERGATRSDRLCAYRDSYDTGTCAAIIHQNRNSATRSSSKWLRIGFGLNLITL